MRLVKCQDVDERGGSYAVLVPLSEIANGGSSVALEEATGDVDGVNTDFMFVGTPVLIMRNGVVYSPDAYSVEGTTVTITVPPDDGQITGLTTS